MVRYVGNMHGDEAVGRQLIYYLAHYLLTNYNRYSASNFIIKGSYFPSRSSVVKYLVDNTEIYLLPSLNPDGFSRSSASPPDSYPCRHKYEFQL